MFSHQTHGVCRRIPRGQIGEEAALQQHATAAAGFVYLLSAAAVSLCSRGRVDEHVFDIT